VSDAEPLHDVVGLGEVMLRLASRAPTRLEQARELDVSFGGAEANVLCALARLGHRTVWVSALPANVWGERLGRELTGHGVDVSRVVWREGAGGEQRREVRRRARVPPPVLVEPLHQLPPEPLPLLGAAHPGGEPIGQLVHAPAPNEGGRLRPVGRLIG